MMASIKNVLSLVTTKAWLRYALAATAFSTMGIGQSAQAQVVYLPNSRITFLEATYMPTRIVFQLSAGDAVCPAGKFITWASSNPENVKAVFALLLQASTNGQTIYAVYDPTTVYTGPFGAQGCAISFVGLRQ
jgi:hypothetical protein